MNQSTSVNQVLTCLSNEHTICVIGLPTVVIRYLISLANSVVGVYYTLNDVNNCQAAKNIRALLSRDSFYIEIQ